MISEVSQNTRIQDMEKRIEALEATVNELQTLLQNIERSPSTATDQRLKKMQNYQQELDHMFGIR